MHRLGARAMRQLPTRRSRRHQAACDLWIGASIMCALLRTERGALVALRAERVDDRLRRVLLHAKVEPDERVAVIGVDNGYFRQESEA